MSLRGLLAVAISDGIGRHFEIATLPSVARDDGFAKEYTCD